MFCFENLLGEDVLARKSSVRRRFTRNFFCQKTFGHRKGPLVRVTPEACLFTLGNTKRLIKTKEIEMDVRIGHL